MDLKVITPEARTWDQFVELNGGHLLQTSRWGALKRTFGWQDVLVAMVQNGKVRAGALVLFRRLPLGMGTIAYVPRGPAVNWEDNQTVEALIGALDGAARRRRAVLLKIEPDERDTPQMREHLARLGFRESMQSVQPPRTVLIDVAGSEEDILARMNQGTRRKIRIALRKGVVVRQGDAQALETFSALIQATGARHEFGVHSPAYYRRAFELFVPDRAALLMAAHEGRDLAGLFVFALGKTAWYFYGASSDEGRDLMPTYLLQWEAMQWARARGCTTYDLWGIPDEDTATLEAQFQTRSDGLWGVYGFKRGFGGEVVRSVGAWDRVYRPLMYQLYEIAMRQKARE